MASLIDLLGLGAGAIGGAMGARDESVVAQRAAQQQSLLDELKRKQEDEDRAQRNRYMEAQIRNFESLDRERNTPDAPKPVAPILPPWQREGFTTEDEYIRFKNREAGATRAPQTPAGGGNPSEGERRAAGLTMSGEEGYRNIELLVNGGDDPNTPEVENLPPMRRPTLWDKARGAVGFGVGNAMSSPQIQQLEQAAYDLTEAWMRLTSGGAISDEEIRRASQALIPQPGDSPEVLAQKSRARRIRIEAVRAASGRAAPPQAPQQTSPMRPAPALSPSAGRVPVAQRYNLERP